MFETRGVVVDHATSQEGTRSNKGLSGQSDCYDQLVFLLLHDQKTFF